ncbi:hypothetical protein H8F26_13670 [Synechococcus sp. CBW1006]|nr:hypothetical protein H8F26_13670 [Synechococcus sp. CBW1006]
MINDYRDKSFLLNQQKEFDEISPSYAFTEMRAFLRFRQASELRTRSLSSFFSDQGIWFDDCICQSHGFSMAWADKARRKIKDLYWKNLEVCALSEDKLEFRFATLNCSWLPIDAFEWLESPLQTDKKALNYLSSYLKFSIRERINFGITKGHLE